MAETSQIKSSELEMRKNESDTWLAKVMKAMTNAFSPEFNKYFPKRRDHNERVRSRKQ